MLLLYSLVAFVYSCKCMHRVTNASHTHISVQEQRAYMWYELSRSCPWHHRVKKWVFFFLCFQSTSQRTYALTCVCEMNEWIHAPTRVFATSHIILALTSKITHTIYTLPWLYYILIDDQFTHIAARWSRAKEDQQVVRDFYRKSSSCNATPNFFMAIAYIKRILAIALAAAFDKFILVFSSITVIYFILFFWFW